MKHCVWSKTSIGHCFGKLPLFSGFPTTEQWSTIEIIQMISNWSEKVPDLWVSDDCASQSTRFCSHRSPCSRPTKGHWSFLVMMKSKIRMEISLSKKVQNILNWNVKVLDAGFGELGAPEMVILMQVMRMALVLVLKLVLEIVFQMEPVLVLKLVLVLELKSFWHARVS